MENSMKFRMAGREDDNHGKALLGRALNARLSSVGFYSELQSGDFQQGSDTITFAFRNNHVSNSMEAGFERDEAEAWEISQEALSITLVTSHEGLDDYVVQKQGDRFKTYSRDRTNRTW